LQPIEKKLFRQEAKLHPGIYMKLQDFRYALRGMRRSPGFTLTAVLTLALGIGANTAIFSVLNAVLLRPLPFGEPARLVYGWGKTVGTDIAGIGPPPFRDYRAQNRTLEQFAAMEVWTSNVALTGERQPEQVKEGIVSANFYDALGLRPIAGRGFVEADEKENLPRVVILGHAFWQQHFGSSTSVIGKTLRLDGNSVTIAGVMPDVPLLMNVQVMVPMPMLNPGMSVRRSHFLRLIAKLKPDVTLTQAQADLDAIALRLGDQYPDSDKGWSVRLQPLNDVLIGPVKDVLLILLCAVGLVLLIACANVANLLLVRAAGRRKEVAIRAALGASRGRLVGQFLTESLALALLGGAAGILLASWGVAALRASGPADLPRLDEIGVDGTVLGFAVLLSILTGIVFGLAPALHAVRDQVQSTLKGASQGGTRRGGILVAAELAISLVLLISAGLALKSVWKLTHVDPGFRYENAVTAAVSFPQTSARQPELRIAQLTQAMERIAALPNVESVGAVSELPMTGTENDNLFRIEGKNYPGGPGPGGSADFSIYQRVSGDYFQTMGTPLLQGRSVGRQDTATSLPVIMINEPFARKYFPGQNPIGKRLIIDEGKPVTREIVGVVGGARYFSLARSPDPEMYLPFSQDIARTMNLVVRMRADAADIGAALRAAVASVDPDQPISSLRTLTSIVAGTAAQPRFYGLLLGLFAVVAMLLSAIGLYGVISYAVNRRTREIGIRMALGATSKDILRLVAGQGAPPMVCGLVAGLAAAYFAARLLASRLFEVIPHDSTVFGLVPVGLVAVALVACWAPARRAMGVDPAMSLRQE
jgi:putative ABC transport system permease protein